MKARASLHNRASHQSLRCSHTRSMKEHEGSDQKSDARLKNEFTEDEKYHNLMS